MASNKITYNPAISRRAASYTKPTKKSVIYKFTEDGLDAVLISGEFQGKSVSQVWQMGTEERDLIFSKLYKTDPKMKEIIDKLCCQ